MTAGIKCAQACLSASSHIAALILLRWANNEVGPGATDNNKFNDKERFYFYTNNKAKQYYKDYVTQIVSRYK
jgi:hypothetical protein